MLKARLFLASCLATALVAVPFGGPAAAQEEPQFECFVSIPDLVFIPGEWSIWDLYETDGETWTIRGDYVLSAANELTTAWTETTTEYVACVQAYAEAVAADAVTDAGAAADALLACVTDAVTPLLQSDPPTSRYVEVTLDGVVHVHVGALLDDEVALWNCNGVFVIPG